MRDTLKLSRNMQVECWVVQGEISFAKKRPELLPLLMAVEEFSVASINDISRHLLFAETGRRKVAERWLMIAYRYGLVSLVEEKPAKYTLTEYGEDVLDTEKVFVPQQGLWKIWYSSDPLLSFPILKIESTEVEKSYDIIKSKKDNRESGQRDIIEEIPNALKEYFNEKIAGTTLLSKNEIKLETVEPKGEISKSGLNLQLQWDVAQQTVAITGANKVTSTGPNVPEENLWEAYLKNTPTESSRPLVEYLDIKDGILKFDFESCESKDIISSQKSIDFPKISWEQFGTFNPFTVRNVPIKPIDNADAQKWFDLRLEESVNSFCTKSTFEKLLDSASLGLEQFAVIKPQRSKLASETWKQGSKNRWYLMATEDWDV